MTYEEIKDAARWVEQREDPSMSDDPFMRENTALTSQNEGQWDQDGQSRCNQGCPQYRGHTRPSHSWPAVRAVSVEDHRVDCHEGTDNGNLKEGGGDMGFDPNDYGSVEEIPSLPSTSAPLLSPHIKAAWITYHYE